MFVDFVSWVADNLVYLTNGSNDLAIVLALIVYFIPLFLSLYVSLGIAAPRNSFKIGIPALAVFGFAMFAMLGTIFSIEATVKQCKYFPATAQVEDQTLETKVMFCRERENAYAEFSDWK